MSLPSYAAHAAGFQLGRAVLRLGVDPTGMNSGLKQARTRFDRFAVGAQTAGRVAGVALSAPLFAAGVLAVKVSAEYEQMMKRVQAVSGATGKYLESLKRQTVELAETTKFTMRQVGDAQVFLAMAGLQVTTILKAMPSVLDLAAASGLELARVADLLTNIMTAFQVSADKTVEVMDVLTITFTGSNTSMEQLADALRYVSPSVASLGHTVSETAAAIGILGNQGIQASLAGTYLRAVFRELARPTGQLAKTIEQLGLSTRNMAGEIVNAAEMVEEFERVEAGAAEAARGFGRRGGTGAAALVAATSDEIRRMQSLHRLSLTTTREISTTMLDTLLGDLAILRAKFETFLERVSQSGLGQTVRSFVKLLQRMFDGLNSLSSESLKNLLAISAVLVVLPPTMLLISGGALRVIRAYRLWAATAASVATSMKAVAAASKAATAAVATSAIIAPTGIATRPRSRTVFPAGGGRAETTYFMGAGKQAAQVQQAATRATRAMTVMQRAGTAAFGAVSVAARGLAGLLWNPVTGILVAMYALGEWSMRKAEKEFRSAEIAAMEYKEVLEEIARLEQKQAEQGELPTAHRGGVPFHMLRQFAGRKETAEELEKLRARENDAFEEQRSAELNTYAELARAMRAAEQDLKTGKIGLEQYLSDMRTIATEGEREMQGLLIHQQRFFQGLIDDAEARSEYAEKNLVVMWNVMEEIGRMANALEEGILKGDLTREAGEGMIGQATALLTRLSESMDPTAAQMFGAHLEMLRERFSELIPEVRTLTYEVMKLAESYLETTRMDQRKFLISARNLPLSDGVIGQQWRGFSNILPGVTEVQRIASENAQAYMDANREAMESEKNRQAMRKMFSDFGKRLGRRFASAIVEGSDTLAEDFRKALTAESMARIFTKAGDFLGKKLADQVAKVLTVEQAGWVATIIGAATALTGWMDSRRNAAVALQEAAREEYAATNEELVALYAQLGEEQKAIYDAANQAGATQAELLELVNQLLEEHGTAAEAAAEAERELEAANRELAAEFEQLARAAMDSEYALEDLKEFINTHFDLSVAMHQVEDLYGMIDQLKELRGHLDFVRDLEGAIQQFLPPTGIEKLVQTGIVDAQVIAQLGAAGGDVSLVKKFGAELQKLREFEALVDQYREAGKVSQELVDRIHELTGADFSHMLTQVEDVNEELQKNLGLIRDLKKGLEEFIPGRTQEATVLSDLLRTGRLSASLMQQLRDAGAPEHLVKEFADTRAALFAAQQNTERWRDEFHFEAEEYRLRMAVEEAAFNLHSELDLTMRNLEGAMDENRLALEQAIEAAAGILTEGVQNAAVALAQHLESLGSSLENKIADLIKAIEDLIEVLKNLRFPTGGGWQNVRGWNARPPGEYPDPPVGAPKSNYDDVGAQVCRSMGGTPVFNQNGLFIRCDYPKPTPVPPVPPPRPAPPPPDDPGGNFPENLHSPQPVGPGDDGGGSNPVAVHLSIPVSGMGMTPDQVVDTVKNAVETNRGRFRDTIREAQQGI